MARVAAQVVGVGQSRDIHLHLGIQGHEYTKRLLLGVSNQTLTTTRMPPRMILTIIQDATFLLQGQNQAHMKDIRHMVFQDRARAAIGARSQC